MNKKRQAVICMQVCLVKGCWSIMTVVNIEGKDWRPALVEIRYLRRPKICLVHYSFLFLIPLFLKGVKWSIFTLVLHSAKKTVFTVQSEVIKARLSNTTKTIATLNILFVGMYLAASSKLSRPLISAERECLQNSSAAQSSPGES